MNSFFEMLKEQYGEDIAKEICENRGLKRKTTFRVNTLKADNDKICLLYTSDAADER